MSKISGENKIAMIGFHNYRQVFFSRVQKMITDEYFWIKDRMTDTVWLHDGLLKKSAVCLDLWMKLYNMPFPFISKFNFTEWRLKSLHDKMITHLYASRQGLF